MDTTAAISASVPGMAMVPPDVLFYDITGTGNSDPETSDKQHSCKDNGRNTLHSFMSVLVLFV